MIAEDWRQGGFGLYVHWPYCQAKCPYCDFNSHVTDAIDHGRWAEAYLSEIKRVSGETSGRVLSSVFFGGGTPSLMAPDTVARILDTVREEWACANDLEITLEANPTSVEVDKLAAFRAAGINRVSIGLQSLRDPDLTRLGRLHSAQEGRAAYEVARQTFDRVSFDLIYARQDQSLKAWQTELTEAMAMEPDHLSLYQLTIEDGTAFGDRYRLGRLHGLPDEDLAADMYDATQEICEAHGLPAYEVSNHAKDGAESRHNLIYWRYGDYVGIGPGAHGRVTLGGSRFATETARAPLGWLKLVEQRGSGETKRDTVEPAEQSVEYMLMAMRLREGLDLARWERLAGRSMDLDVLEQLSGHGLVRVTETHLCATQSGRRVLNTVIAELLAGD